MDAAAGPRVTLLDGFAIRLPDGAGSTVPLLPRGVQRLVAYLSLCRRTSRAVIAGHLWPESSEDHAQGSLRSALWRVQKVVPGLVTAAADTLTLSQAAHVDVSELTEWARQAMDPSRPVDACRSSGMGSELLPGWYEDWVLLERERLRQLTLHAWEASAQKLAGAARFGEAVEAAYAAVRAEPLRESAHRTLMLVHLAEGNAAEAARVYASFRTMLADEVGEAPSDRMGRLLVTAGARESTSALLRLRAVPTEPERRPS